MRAASERDLLPHEFVHSWNGKFRRPADLWTPSYDMPMRGSLLWVYEGMTQYWGHVLTARSGLWSREQALDSLVVRVVDVEGAIRSGAVTLPIDTTGIGLSISPGEVVVRVRAASVDSATESRVSGGAGWP